MSRFSPYAFIVLLWMLVCAFQYGYSISALNQIQAVLTCQQSGGSATLGSFGLPSCIPMTDTTFSLITAIFTIGGLASSLVTNIVMDKRGRKTAVRLSGSLTCIGSALMAVASSSAVLSIGRFFIGLGAGVGLCVVPVFLSEVAPPNIKGSIGVLNQLGIVIGILVTQIFGFVLAYPGTWRWVFIISTGLSALQFFVTPLMVESPAWLNAHKYTREAKVVVDKLWISDTGRRVVEAEDEEALLRAAVEDVPSPNAVSVWQALKAPELKRPLFVVCSCMILQQISGINAVLYYSNDILSKVLPQSAAYISLGITVVNALMTFPPIFLIDRMGKKNILALSIAGILSSLVALGYAIDHQYNLLSSIAIITFVATFAVGLGPIPFVIIADISPFYAVSAISAIALSLNWGVNFAVGAAFLNIRNALSNEDGTGQGRVFYLFAWIASFFALVIYRSYR